MVITSIDRPPCLSMEPEFYHNGWVSFPTLPCQDVGESIRNRDEERKKEDKRLERHEEMYA